MASTSKKTTACTHHGASAPPPILVESEDQRASLESIIRSVDSLPDTAKKPANKGTILNNFKESYHLPLDLCYCVNLDR